MHIPELKIGNLTAKVPIIQGGMGVRISLASLAAAVANEGGIGTISSIGLDGLNTVKNNYDQYVTGSRDALINEIRKAKQITKGPLAVNIMGVSSNADDLIKTAQDEGINIIAYGAGIPIRLPAMVTNKSVNLVPIISSDRVASIILKNWDKKYNRIPDGFILEGPKAGGHLGFSEEQINDIDNHSIEKILPEIFKVIKPYEDKHNRKIPIVVAGGVFDGNDIAKMIKIGASGVQMGTRFVCTEECGVSDEFKQAFINATKDDVQIVKSPVGMIGRAIRNKFIIDLEQGKKNKIMCPYQCLTRCKAKDAEYCIAKVLLNSYIGDVDNGLIFCGLNVYKVKEITTVKKLMGVLMNELASALTCNV